MQAGLASAPQLLHRIELTFAHGGGGQMTAPSLSSPPSSRGSNAVIYPPPDPQIPQIPPLLRLAMCAVVAARLPRCQHRMLELQFIISNKCIN